LSLGDHDGRIVISSFCEKYDEECGRTLPHLQFFDEIYAFDMEFNFQKLIEVPPKVNAIEWLNKGDYNKFLAANEKCIKLYSIK